MPRGMLGDELAQRARRVKGDLKVLLTSGYVVAPLGAGTSFTLLQKPYRQDDLARAVREALDQG